MNKNVYIVGDLPISLTEEEYLDLFSKEEIKRLEKNETIDWTDSRGNDHKVRLVSN
jgi:hypothetical protein